LTDILRGMSNSLELEIKVAQFAKDNDLIIVTNDGKLIKQCNLLEIEFVALDLVVDLARKVLKYDD